MRSVDLIKLRAVSSEKRRRVLFINPKTKGIPFSYPHNGLAILSAILKKRGHEVLVIDYEFIRKDKNKEVSFFINFFKPDVIGLSIYTPSADEANRIISEIRIGNPKIPIMAGGAHPTIYTPLMQKDKRIDYIFVGEAELTIIKIVEKAKRENNPKIIFSKEILNVNCAPFPDFTVFHEYKSLRGYPLMTSRGCPNKCSFCSAVDMSHRIWRSRKPEDCIEELEIANKKIHPHLHISVQDDNPTVDKKRFYKFLELFYHKMKKNNTLHIEHTRADGIDETLLLLMKKCGCTEITIGVEHGHPEVFKLVNKGESHEQIIKACKLIKKHGFKLGTSFIVGLPGDSLERTDYSIKFSRMLGAEYINIGLIVPYMKSFARGWFEKNGKVYDEKSTLMTAPGGFACGEPCVETSNFTKEERKKAYYRFMFLVAQTRLKLKWMPQIFSIAIKYRLYYEFFYWLPRGIIESLKNEWTILKIALNVYQKDGFKELIRRYEIRNKR